MKYGKYIMGLFALAVPLISLKAETHQVFNPETKTFNVSYGGVSEEYLKRLQESMPGNFGKSYLRYVQEKDSAERSLVFYPDEVDNLKGSPFSSGKVYRFSAWDQYITTIKNQELIQKIHPRDSVEYDNNPWRKKHREEFAELNPDSLPDYYKPLGELLDKLGDIAQREISGFEKLEGMYSCIGKADKTGEMKITTNVDVADILNGKDGLCIHVASAYYSLLRHFGIECYIKEGFCPDLEMSHIWLSAVVDSVEIDIDPSLYRRGFVPLNIRNKQIERNDMSTERFYEDLQIEVKTR